MQFDRQRNRGTQGFGLFDGEHNHLVKSATEDRITHWLKKDKNRSSILMFHHRFPTSTINTRKANHPFATRDSFGKTEYVLIHNGHISNSRELFVKHQELGIEYFSMLEDNTFTDSEALLWEFALVIEGKKKELEARGGNAFICMQLVDGKPKKLFFGRNSNPIYITKDAEEFQLSSTGLDWTKMKAAGKSEKMIDAQKLYCYYYGNGHLTERPFNIPQYLSTTYTRTSQSTYPYGGYDDDYRSYERQESLLPPHLMGRPGMSKKARKAQKHAIKVWRREHGLDGVREWATPGSHAATATESHSELETSVSRANTLLLPENPNTDPTDESAFAYMKYTKQEVQNVCITYLSNAGGNFFTAYNRMGKDLDIFRAQPVSDANIHSRIVLNNARKELNNDPEWDSPESISSIWRALCQNNAKLQSSRE